MNVTLKPILSALGFAEEKQQQSLIKLLQAAGAFGDVKGVNGVLTDQQCEAILSHVTFNDTAQAIKLLHEITQEHLIRPHDFERPDCKDSELFQKYRPELLAALHDAGMLTEKKPSRQHYDYVLVMGATEGEINGRFEHLKELWEQGVRFDKIVLLGSERPLNREFEPGADTIGADGEKITTEMQVMETQYYAKSAVWPAEMQNVRVFEVDTFNKDDGSRANTQDTVKSWLKTKPHASDVLVMSSQPYVHYQDAAVKSVLPEDFKVETIGGKAPEDVRISVALDSFSRQIDVNLEKLTKQLKAQPLTPPPVVRIDPATIKVDAATYQFRHDGDATTGVTEKGRYKADKWDPVLHGDPIMVHERLDGTMYVADGHHRVDLAKELNAKGTGPGNILATVLSEKQGYTAKDAKIIAAYKNIAHGQTDVIETARVFKEAYSGEVHTEYLPSLQMDKGNLRMGFTMSKLSDKVLDQVAKEKIEPKIAAKLAEMVPDDPARQEAVMQIISKKLHQHYVTPGESHPTSINVNLTSLARGGDVKKPEMNSVPGFVARLAMEANPGERSLS